MPGQCRQDVATAMSKSLCCVPLEGCLSYGCESSPGSGCDDTWRKARLSWILADHVRETISHYLVWTCCPKRTVRTMSAASAKADAATSEAGIADAVHVSDAAAVKAGDETVCTDYSRDDSGADQTADGGPPSKISRQDQHSAGSTSAPASTATVSSAAPMSLLGVSASPDDGRMDDVKLSYDTGETASGGLPAVISRGDQCCADTESTSVWRCLGVTPVTSFSIESKNLLDCQRNFRVQPVLYSGAVLPHVSIVIK